MDGFEVLEQLAADRAAARPAGDRDLVARGRWTTSCAASSSAPRTTCPSRSTPVLLKARIGASLEKKRLRDQQKELVRRFATSEVAQDLQQSGFALGGRRVHGSVMFSDIRGFTALVESQPPEETIELLNTYYTLMFDAISGHGGVVNQMIGDGLMAIFGAPLPLADHAGAAVRAALEMVELIELFNVERARGGQARRSASASASPPARWWPATPARSSARPTPASATPSTSRRASRRTPRSRSARS